MDVGIECHDTQGLFYLPVWLIRFFLFIFIGSILCLFPTQQTQFLIILNQFYTCWYCLTRPHASRLRHWHELFHEVFSMIAAYHLILYSNYCPYDVQFTAGYSFYVCLIFVICVNLVNVALQVYFNIKKEQR